MTKPRSPREQELMIDTLIRRKDYIQLIIDSHLRWMRVTDDQKMKSIHRALVDSLLGVAEQYDVLLYELQKPL